MLEPEDDIYRRLSMPFPTSSISWRVGSTNERDGKTFGLPLAYIDARDVMDRLDDVVGPQNWQDKYSFAGPKTICAIGINVGEWVWKEDGAGDTNYEADKGALSDAFKRAAVRWGIGRYLYGLKSGLVEVEKRGKNVIIPDNSRKALDAQHDKAIEHVEWGDRFDRNTYRLLLASLRMIEIHELATFENNNEGVISQLPVAMRANLREKLGQMAMEHDQPAEPKKKPVAPDFDKLEKDQHGYTEADYANTL